LIIIINQVLILILILIFAATTSGTTLDIIPITSRYALKVGNFARFGIHGQGLVVSPGLVKVAGDAAGFLLVFRDQAVRAAVDAGEVLTWDAAREAMGAE
jgi:hypothetical protein